MAYNISATSVIGPIVSRRTVPQRALKQARDYRMRGFTDIKIINVETGEVHEPAALAAIVQAQLPAGG
jgi:hypothetical protein